MNAQLIIDCSGRTMTALLAMPDGSLLPVSQDIRNVATRHVSTDVFFDPRASEHADFVWEDALESLSRARPRDLFQRARRIGLRRPWDTQTAGDALQIASPLRVLSSAAALADRAAAPAVAQFSVALLDAQLDPVLAFAFERCAPAATAVVAIVPSRIGRVARLGLHRLLRRRGAGSVTLIRRDLATALLLIEEAADRAIVFEADGDDVLVQHVGFDGVSRRTLSCSRTVTLHGSGWSFWAARVAAALGTPRSPAFDRALLSFVSGCPDTADAPLTRAAVEQALDVTWVAAARAEWNARLAQHGIALDAPLLFAGEIFAIDPIRTACSGTEGVPVLEAASRGVANAIRWHAADAARTLHLSCGGTLRLDTQHGDAVELLASDQLPAAGEACHVERTFRFAGEHAAGTSFLVHLQWGSDRDPDGNATLAAIPLELQADADRELHVRLSLRRSGGGARITGTAEARNGRNTVRAQFSHDLEVRT